LGKYIENIILEEKNMVKTCRSFVLTADRHMEMQEFPIPEIHDDDALLKVEMVGVCGSDPGFYKGKTPHAMPLMMGHEIVGRIEEIGAKKAAISGLKKGDRVIVENRFGCGVCKQCVTGHYSKCVDKLGYGVFTPATKPPHLWGAYSEYLYLPQRAVQHKIDESVPLEAAVLTTSVIGNNIHWLQGRGGLAMGHTVVIAGAGQQGLAATLIALECGASKIIILGRGTPSSAKRLAMAKDFGAHYVVNTDETDPVQFVREVTGGEMADLFMDTSGSSHNMEISLDLVKTYGTIVTPGLYGDHLASMDFDKLVMKELSIVGAHAQTYESNEAAIKLVESRKYPFERMVTHKFLLEDAEKAVLTAAREIPGENPIKCVICPNGFIS